MSYRTAQFTGWTTGVPIPTGAGILFFVAVPDRPLGQETGVTLTSHLHREHAELRVCCPKTSSWRDNGLLPLTPPPHPESRQPHSCLTFGRGWAGGNASTYGGKTQHKKRGPTSTPHVGFKPTFPESERSWPTPWIARALWSVTAKTKLCVMQTAEYRNELPQLKSENLYTFANPYINSNVSKTILKQITFHSKT
jgi:hypothetical protein